MGKGRGAYGVLVGKPERGVPLEKPQRRWEGNIKMNFVEIELGHGLD
jgi:hypothetical protein